MRGRPLNSSREVGDRITHLPAPGLIENVVEEQSSTTFSARSKIFSTGEKCVCSEKEMSRNFCELYKRSYEMTELHVMS